MQTRCTRWERPVALIGCGVLLALAACGADGLTGNGELPPQVPDPSDVQTPAGALSLYAGALVRLRGVVGSYDGTSYVLASGMLTDRRRGKGRCPYASRMDRGRLTRFERPFSGRRARTIIRVLWNIIRSVLVMAAVAMTFLEAMLTLPVISSPLAADARDDDFDMWLAFMPWTVGLWLVTGVLIFRGVRRNRTVDRVKP